MNRKRALKILGAETDTDIREIKKRYRELVRMTHPDSVKEHDYPYEVHEINEAYNYLLTHLFDDEGQDNGRYMWIEDEDFPLFLKSLYDTAKSVISEDDYKKNISRSDDDELLKDITYLIAGQFFGSDLALSLMKHQKDGSYHAKAMIELMGGKIPKEGHVLYPQRVENHIDHLLMLICG